MQSITNFKNIKSYHATVMYLDVDIENPGVQYCVTSSQQLDTSFMDEITVGSLVHVIVNKEVIRGIIVDIDLEEDTLTTRFKNVTDTFEASTKPDMYRKQYASRKRERDESVRKVEELEEEYNKVLEEFIQLSFSKQSELVNAKKPKLLVNDEEKVEEEITLIVEDVEIEIEEGLKVNLSEDSIILIEDNVEEPQPLTKMYIKKDRLKRKAAASGTKHDDHNYCAKEPQPSTSTGRTSNSLTKMLIKKDRLKRKAATRGTKNNDHDYCVKEPQPSTSTGKTSNSLTEMLIKKHSLRRKAAAKSTKKNDDDYYNPSSSKTIKADENNMVRIGENGTLVRKSVLDDIDWKKHRAAARRLLMELFDRETLASQTLSGKPSPAFKYIDERQVKTRLDPKITEDIINTVIRCCKVSSQEAKLVVTTKCADENKMAKKKKLKEEEQKERNNKVEKKKKSNKVGKKKGKKVI